jgi:hypothetical protein
VLVVSAPAAVVEAAEVVVLYLLLSFEQAVVEVVVALACVFWFVPWLLIQP